MFSKKWFADTVERALATFAEAALGLYVLAGPGDVLSLDLAKGAAAAGVIAAAAVVKAAIASKVGDPDSASLASSAEAVDGA